MTHPVQRPLVRNRPPRKEPLTHIAAPRSSEEFCQFTIFARYVQPRYLRNAAELLLAAAALLHTWSVGPAAAQPPDIASARPEKGLVIRVMSLNIRYNNPGDGPNAWPRRRDAVAQLIRDSDVDVAGLQEVLGDQIDDLQRRLPDYQWYGVGRDDGKEMGEFVPVFFRKDRWDIGEKGVFWLSEQPSEPGRRDWGAGCARVTTWVLLRHKDTHKSLVVFNTHFDHASAEARRKGAALLHSRLARFPDSAMILTGDLNCLPGSPPYTILTRSLDTDGAGNPNVQMVDSYDAAKHGRKGPDSTWNGFEKIVPGRRIDFIMFSGPVEALEHHTLDVRSNGRFVSDHLPVLAELVIH